MKKKLKKFDLRNSSSLTQKNLSYEVKMDKFFLNSVGNNSIKLRDFPKFVSRQSLSNFLSKSEIFKNIINIHGHIIECGVYLGGSLLTWGNLSAIYEPYNHTRRVIGFDSFKGFEKLSKKDKKNSKLGLSKSGGLSKSTEKEIKKCIELYDLNRPIGHIPRIEIVSGDAKKTIPNYLKKNKHLVVSMLFLDFDLYEPSKIALKTFLPRMPKGSILVFDELNQFNWPGETVALLEEYGIRNLKIKRFEFAPAISYAVLD